MNKVYIQRWEESLLTNDIVPDGCSLHSDVDSHQNYLKEFNSRKSKLTPKNYERSIGPLIECFISDQLFNRLQIDKNFRLSEIELNNLISFEDIILKYD